MKRQRRRPAAFPTEIDRRTSRVMTTTTSLPVLMIFRSYNIKPVVYVRPRW